MNPADESPDYLRGYRDAIHTVIGKVTADALMPVMNAARLFYLNAVNVEATEIYGVKQNRLVAAEADLLNALHEVASLTKELSRYTDEEQQNNRQRGKPKP